MITVLLVWNGADGLARVMKSADTKTDLAAAVLIERLVQDSYAPRVSDAIQPLQWSIMRYLNNATELRRTMSHARDFLGLTHAPVVRAIKKLGTRGLVAYAPHPTDSRSAILNLTDAGRDALDSDPMLRIVERMHKLSSDERRFLQKVVQKLALAR